MNTTDVPVMEDEGDFRRYVIGRVLKSEPRSQTSYIESHETSAGIPDLNIYMRGRDVWIELKVLSDTKPAKMRPTQKRWHVDRFNSGGMSWVMTLDLTQMKLLIIPGNVAAGLGTNIGVWRNVAAAHPVEDVVDVIRSMARRVKSGQ